MEGFNGSLNGEQQEQASIAKGIIFALIGMLIGIIPYLITGGVFELRLFGIVGGTSVGFGVSFGWHLSKGPEGNIRQMVMVLLSIIGSIVTVILGYAVFHYRLGIGASFMNALDFTINGFFNGFGEFFNDAGMLTRDSLLTAGIAIATSWKKFNPNANGNLEELENDDLEDLNTNDPIPTHTEMDDVLNQDIPTLDVDQD